jgi:hypothetical protein
MKRSAEQIKLDNFPFGDLLVDLRLITTSYLPICDYLHLSETSTEYHQLLQNSEKWKELFIRDFSGDKGLELANLFFEFVYEKLDREKSSKISPFYKHFYRETVQFFHTMRTEMESEEKNQDKKEEGKLVKPKFLTSDRSNVITQWSDFTKSQFVLFLCQCFCLDEDVVENYHFEEAEIQETYSRYFKYALVFLVHNQIDFQVKDNLLILPQGNYRCFLTQYMTTMATALLLGSTNLFFEDKKRYKDMCVGFLSLLDYGCAKFFEKNDGTKLKISIELHLDLSSVLMHALSVLNDEIIEEKLLKESLKLRVIEIMNYNSKKGPIYYYNMACMYAQFKEFEECKKYYHWCFNYVDGKYFNRWDPQQLLELYAKGRFDVDYNNVRELDWFKIEDYDRNLAEQAEFEEAANLDEYEAEDVIGGGEEEGNDNEEEDDEDEINDFNNGFHNVMQFSDGDDDEDVEDLEDFQDSYYDWRDAL